MMISRPAPKEPPIMATMRLGTIAMDRVNKFRIHVFIFNSKKPYRIEYIYLIIHK